MNISDQVINRNTLTKPFGKPSGGEENRIGVIQTILPLYLGIELNEQIPPILFVDEATSGLDDDTYKLVRSIFNELRDEHNITIVIIDHHDNLDKKVTHLYVKKRDRESTFILPEKIQCTSSLGYLVDLFIGIEEEEKEKEKEPIEKKQKPEVWVELTK